MGEAKRKRATGPTPDLELLKWQVKDIGFDRRTGLITKLAGMTIPPDVQHDVTKFFGKWNALVLEQEGTPDPRDNTRRRAAFHEAGHCVVGAALGTSVARTAVGMSPQGEWFGRTFYDKDTYPGGITPDTPLEKDWAMTACLIAGFIGEDPAGTRISSSIDEKVVFTLLTGDIMVKLGLPGPVNVIESAGLDEVWSILADHRDAHTAVADALMARSELDREQLDDIMKGVHDPARERAKRFVARLQSSAVLTRRADKTAARAESEVDAATG